MNIHVDLIYYKFEKTRIRAEFTERLSGLFQCIHVSYACAWMCTRECKCINIYTYVCMFFRDKHVIILLIISSISGFCYWYFDLQFARTRVNYSGSSPYLHSFILHSVYPTIATVYNEWKIKEILIYLVSTLFLLPFFIPSSFTKYRRDFL